MDCQAEVQLVRLRLDDLDGVRRLDFDLTDRTVMVTHTTNSGEIEAALRTLGLDTTKLDEREGAADGPVVDPGVERRALAIALVINAGFFVAELTAGFISNSLGLIADSLDMAADSGVYALSLVAVGGSAARKNRLATTSGYVQLGLAFAGLVEVTRRFIFEDTIPDVTTMITLSLLALLGNMATLVILARVRSDEVHLQASWIFTANDIKVNGLVIAAAIGVAVFDSAVPDLIAGGMIFLVVAGGARRILKMSSAPQR
jgi:Co/Zn/Cd efflux system component